MSEPLWAATDAPGVCRRGHETREDKCPACHDTNLLDNMIAIVLKSFGTAIAVVTGEPTTTHKGE